MANPLPVAPADQTSSRDEDVGELPFASELDTEVIQVPETQPGDEPAAILWFQQQQAQFAARFLGPWFREG